MGRARKGTGGIYKHKSRPGYIGELTLDGRRHRVYGATKTDVQAKLTKLRSDHEAGLLVADKSVTVAEVVDQFMTRKLPNLTSNGRPLTPATLGTYQWAAGIVTEHLGKTQITKLTVQRVERMFDDLAAGGLSKASLSKVKIKLGQFIEFAERRDQVRRNVARLAEIPAEAKQRRDRRSLAPNEARTLLEALRGHRNGAQYALGLLLGLRPGEAAALFWDDLDLDGDPPTVNVTRGLQRDGGLVSISDNLKTEGSKRTLALPDVLVDWLKEHRRQQLKDRLAAGRWIDDRLVFTTPTGAVTDPSRTRKELAVICEEAGITPVRPNELRHSCASLLADQGVRFEVIADLLGHESTRMLEATYRHRLRPVIDVATTAAWMDAQ